jgi:Cu(I)/Ag(I) efflux system membrane fusion protein
MKRWPVAAVLAVAIVVGLVWWRYWPTPPRAATAPEHAHAERPILYWYDPMVPDQHFDKPGRSPFMDMDLVPKYADEETAESGIVSIDPRMAQNLGVRTAQVAKREVAPVVRAVGSVGIDETRVYAIESRATGWVETLEVRAVGDPVRRGQRVAGVYSPDLYAAQSELALAARSGDATLINAARQRLTLLGLPESQIANVVESRKAQRTASIVAPVGGVVTELNVREGQQTASGMPLMRVADLSRIWILIDIPEAQASVVRAGSGAQARLRALPGRTFDGEVTYVYPQLDPTTRTIRARVAIDNPRAELKPGMFADVTLGDGTRSEALVVPSEAVIRTGTRTVVIVAEGPGSYRPVAVEAGSDVGADTVILAGLEAGQKVVVSGQFLLDSEANLQGAFDRLEGKHQHQ